MDISYLVEYANPVAMGICLIVGYLVKTLRNRKLNQLIPIIVAILGVVIIAWIHGGINATLVLEGLVSGLASTGLYEALRNLFALNEGESPDA